MSAGIGLGYNDPSNIQEAPNKIYVYAANDGTLRARYPSGDEEILTGLPLTENRVTINTGSAIEVDATFTNQRYVYIIDGVSVNFNLTGAAENGTNFEVRCLDSGSVATFLNNDGETDVITYNSEVSIAGQGAYCKVHKADDLVYHLNGREFVTSEIPLQVQGLDFWYDFSDEATIGLNGINVESVDDKSGNNRDLLQSTAASQPQYILGGKNSLNTARFDGSDDFFDVDASLADKLNFKYTMFIVSIANVTQNSDLIGGSSSNLRMRSGPTRFSSGYRGTASNSSYNYQNTWTAYAHIIKDANHQLYTNATLRATTNKGTSTSTGFRIAGDPNGADYANVEIAEILFYPRELIDGEREKIENYLIAKWGL